MKRSYLPVAAGAIVGLAASGILWGLSHSDLMATAGAAGKKGKKAATKATSTDLWVEGATGGLSDDAVVKMSSFAKLAKTVSPSVVFITTEVSGSGHFDPFGRGPRGRGVGSGFVINDDGLILTNYHVVKDAKTIRVRTHDDRVFDAKRIGADEKVDVALIEVKGDHGLKPVPLGDSHSLDIGEWVVAIGNPYGYSHSVTAGIVSAKGRTDIIPGSPYKGPVPDGYYSFIQTDASINPGNSGGPLINIKGEVIGINTAINAHATGIAFAIPIDVVKKMLPDLHSKGYFERSGLGVQIESVSDELARKVGLDHPHGALIVRVEEGSPADRAGLSRNDVVLAFAGEKIRSSADLRWLAAHYGVGRTADLLVWRDGSRKSVKVTLASLDRALGAAPKPSPWRKERDDDDSGGGSGDRDALGLSVGPVPSDMAYAFGLEPGTGVRITSVDDHGPAASKLRRDDIIVRISDKPSGRGKVVRSPADFYRRVKDFKSGTELVFELRRGHRRVFATVRK